MIKDVLIDVGSEKIILAMLEDSQVVEVRVEKVDKQSLVGNIYRGKVERVLSGMQSAFVDIGLDEKNAYLYVKDVLPVGYSENGGLLPQSNDLPDISYFLSQGQEITVQIIKDGVGEKGPSATTRLTLPGRYSVLMPQGDFIGISKRIEDLNERARLKSIVSSAKEETCGIIVRTAAENINGDLLIEDIKELINVWGHINKQQQKGKVPRVLYGEAGIIDMAMREYFSGDVGRLVINDKAAYENIISKIQDEPDQMPKIQYYFKDYDMLEFYNVRGAIREALSRKVWLKNGGYLIFDYTEALTVIDVNSGKFVGKKGLEESALQINLEASRTVAHQIRLRNLSGIIIIDFIDMVKREHNEELLQSLRENVKADKIHTVVVGMTKLGLVEMTRKKVRLPLATYFSEKP